MQNTFSQSGNDSKWFLKKSFFKIGKWHSRPPRDPPPFMANAILNFHFDYWHPSLTLRGKKCTALFQTHNWEKSSRVKRLKFWKSGFLAQKSPNITQNLGRKIVIYSSFWIGMAYIVVWYILFHLIAREVAIIYAFLTWYMSNSLKVVQQVCSFMEGFQQRKA